MRLIRRLIGLDEPQETRFFLFIAAWAIGAAIIYWVVSYEAAGTALLGGLGVASGAVAGRLILSRHSATLRPRVAGKAASEPTAAAPGTATTVDDGRLDGGLAGGLDGRQRGAAQDADPNAGRRVVASGAGTGGVDRPFDDPRGLIPDPSMAPLAVGFGAAIAATGLVFGLASVAVGALPFAWGALTWMRAARDELDTTVHLDAVEAGEADRDAHDDSPPLPPATAPGGDGGTSRPAGTSPDLEAPRATAGPAHLSDPEARHEVVIVGGGFAGLYCTRSLDQRGIRATLIDSRNFHLFQPLLYQVATGALSPGDIASSLRAVFERRQAVTVLLGDVVEVRPGEREVVLQDGARLRYETLVVATGSVTSYHGHDEWAERAPGLKTLEEAEDIRRDVLGAFERAEREPDPDARQRLLTFVVVGGGPTGVELAGAIGEIANVSFRRRFRHIDPREARVVIVHAEPRLLGEFPERLSGKAQGDLAKIGVEVLTSTRVTNVDERGVEFEAEDGPGRIDAATVLWAAGVRASPLGAQLAQATGAPLDRSGRIAVLPDLTVPGHPEIFVIGDLALTRDQSTARPLPGVAPVAMQAGVYVAGAIRDRLDGRPLQPFRYRDKGSLATIGTGKAVAKLGRLSFDGRLAWLLWLFVHIMYLVEYQNRLLVLIQWAWSLVTRGRSALLMTGGGLQPGERHVR